MKKVFLTAMSLLLAFSVSAQDFKALYTSAVEGMKAKNYALAAENFQKIISEGGSSSDAAVKGYVTNAKSNLPTCYYQMGGRALMAKKYDESRAAFTQAAKTAQLYNNIQVMTKAKQFIGRTYLVQAKSSYDVKNYAEALPVLEQGYKSDPRNAQMANLLADCYCETGQFQKGMEIYGKVVAMGKSSRYAEDAAKAQQSMERYTINEVAKLQKNKNYDGVIKMADDMLAKNPKSAIAAKVRLQAYSDKKDYTKVIALAEPTAAMQTAAADKSDAYFLLGAAYNAKEMKPQAIEAFKKVTAGTNLKTAQTTIAELSK